MSIYPNVTRGGLFNLSKLAEQQKNQRAIKIKTIKLKQNHDKKLAENLSPLAKKLEDDNELNKKLGDIIKESNSNNETPQLAIENITGTQSLRDTLAFMKESNFFFKIVEKPNGEFFWNNIFIEPLGEARIGIKGEECGINPNIQSYFTNTNDTTKPMDDEDKSTVFNILEKIGFYSMKHNKGSHSAKLKAALYNLLKAIAEI